MTAHLGDRDGDRSDLVSLLRRELARTGGVGVDGDEITGEVVGHLDRALGLPLAEIARRPGKGMRASLVRRAYAIAARDDAPLPDEVPLAIEALHAGSLVIDDVEDDAYERRGAPSLHRIVGVPLAINAGNWLYFWPFALITRAQLPAAIELALRRAFDDAILRCHAGQALDLSVDVTVVPRRAVAELAAATTRWKTGALCGLAASAGAIVAGASHDVVRAFARFGERAGVALQMIDDLSSIRRAGRREKAREDLVGARVTWPWAWIAENTDDVSFRTLQVAASRLRASGGDLDAVVTRMRLLLGDRGRSIAFQSLERAFDELRAVLSLAEARASVVDVREPLDALAREVFVAWEMIDEGR